MKGNDGRGARNALIRKLLAVLVPFAFIIGIISIFRVSKKQYSGNSGIDHAPDKRGKHFLREDELRREMHEMHDRHEEEVYERSHNQFVFEDEEIEKLL